MLIDFGPVCPRLHPGMMVRDDSQAYDHEWVCRVCGTRLYGNAQGGAELPQITGQTPINEKAGNLSGKPRSTTSERRRIQNQTASKRYRAKHIRGKGAYE